MTKLYLGEAVLVKEDFNQFLRSEAVQEVIDFVENIDEDEYIYSYTLAFPGERECLYDEFWFIPNNEGKYLPVLATDINSSSRYSMWRCGNRCNEDEEEDEESSRNVNKDDLLEMVPTEYRKSLNQLLTHYMNVVKSKST